MVALDPRLLDVIDHAAVRHIDRIVQLLHLPVGAMHAIHHGRRGSDQIEVEFPRQPLLDDLQVQQPQEAAAESEAQRGRGLRLVMKAGVVQPQLGQAVAQLLEIVRIHRIQPAPNHRHGRFKSRQGLAVGWRSSVIVSPMEQSATVLIEAVI